MRFSCCVLLAACHVTTRTEITRPVDAKRIQHPEGAIARKPTLVLTDAGQLRFVEPLECPTEDVVVEQRANEIVDEPNYATFVIGVITTAAGGIMFMRGITDDDKSNLATYGGLGTLAVGIPLVVGPMIGNTTELVPIDDRPETTRRPGPSVPCGERGLAARSATLLTRGLEVYGTVDSTGSFSVSPFTIIDVFDPPSGAFDIAARVETPAGARTVNVVIEGPAFAAHSATFLAGADFDTKIEPMRLVPGISPGTLRASLTQLPDNTAAARIVLAVKNDGPGPTFALRGHIAAPGTPALDGRVLYFGQMQKGMTMTREILVPLAPAAADALRNATIDLAVELRDAHGTAPTTPIRFRGPILVDAPR
jgi:hypothetical protein